MSRGKKLLLMALSQHVEQNKDFSKTEDGAKSLINNLAETKILEIEILPLTKQVKHSDDIDSFTPPSTSSCDSCRFDDDDDIADPDFCPDIEFVNVTNVQEHEEEEENQSSAQEKNNKKYRQKKRNEGSEYKTLSGKIIPRRKFKPLTGCKKSCKVLISAEDQKIIFENYWKLPSFNIRLRYICGLVTVTRTKTKTLQKHAMKPRNREVTFRYFIEIRGERILVCKKCFQSTFDETERFLKTVHSKLLGKSSMIDERGMLSPSNKISTVKINEVKNFIREFPAYESHYTRRDTSKKYFASDLTLNKLFEIYCEKLGKSMSLSRFSQIVKEMDIKFKKPSVDTCNVCDSLDMKIKNSTGTEKKEFQKKQQEHHAASDKAYKEKKADRDRSVLLPELKVYTFDLQKCLPTPHLLSNVAFYNRSLWTFNLTIHELFSNIPTNYMWHEAIANRGGNEIASCLFKHLDSLGSEVKNVIFYSDSCVGQNKNSFVSSMFAIYVALSPTIETIEHKFLVPGHTHMECDTTHAAIEKKKKRTSLKIHHPRDWFHLVEGAGSKFRVVEMAQNMFYNFSSIARNKLMWRKTDTEGDRFLWQKVQWLKYSKKFGIVEFKTSLNEEESFKSLKILKRGIKKIEVSDFPLCYSSPVPISINKKRDLERMLSLIDPIYHNFYRNLPTENLPDFHPDITENDDCADDGDN